MTPLEIARAVLESKRPYLFRELPGGQYESHLVPAKGPFLVESQSTSYRGWSMLDAFTAQAIVQVWLVLSETQRRRFEAYGLMTMSRAAVTLYSRAQSRARLQEGKWCV